MLPVYLDVSKPLVRKVNRNILFIIQEFINTCESLDYESFLTDIFPGFCIQRDFEGCKKVLFELREMVKDPFVRTQIKPLYEHALFHLLIWWLEVYDIDLDEKVLISEIVTEDDKYLAKKINDIEEYKSILFQDWDFADVPLLFDIYKKIQASLQI